MYLITFNLTTEFWLIGHRRILMAIVVTTNHQYLPIFLFGIRWCAFGSSNASTWSGMKMQAFRPFVIFFPSLGNLPSSAHVFIHVRCSSTVHSTQRPYEGVGKGKKTDDNKDPTRRYHYSQFYALHFNISIDAYIYLKRHRHLCFAYSGAAFQPPGMTSKHFHYV